jgi:hypothetical protein
MSTKPSKKIDGDKPPRKKRQQPPPPLSNSSLEPPPGFNLAGRPASNGYKLQKTTKIETVRPLQQSSINTASYWSFQFKLNKNQWGRLRSDSLTIVLWGRRSNTTQPVPAVGTAEARAAHWALRANVGQPEIYLDPTVQGTGFIKSVDVSINNVPVPTNGAISNHLHHYVRMARIFSTPKDPFFATTSDIVFHGADGTTGVMRNATNPFDYGTWNSTRGVRIPVYLDGIFPFDYSNRTIETLTGKPEPRLYFPPETTFEIRVHLNRDKIDSIFHPSVTNVHTAYFDEAAFEPPPNNLAITFTDVTLDYEITELVPEEQIRVERQFMSGSKAVYEFDIPRAQYQPLASGASYTSNSFQIQPNARLIYVLFLPSWATFPMETKRKPLSSFSRFPVGATKIKISYGSEQSLITDYFENFGIEGTQSEISKKVFHDYLVDRRLFSRAGFDQLFPRGTDVRSLVQVFPLDLKNHMTSKIEHMKLECHFGGGNTSPNHQQILCLSVHTDGKAICSYSNAQNEYQWTFSPAS